MDVSQYLEIFIDETKEHLQNLNTQILELEQDPNNENTVNEIFRAAHSLKGMAGTMGYKRMQALTHDMENVFSEVRNGNIKVKAGMIDILFQCLDALDEYLNNIQSSADEGTNDNEPLIKSLKAILDDKSDEPAAPAKKETKKAETASDKDLWRSVKLTDTAKRVLSEATRQGKNVFGTTVYVSESCILKAARAFLVFKAVEELGEIIVSEPSAQDVEDEKFDLHFSLIVVSDASLEKLIAAIKNVSEIEDAVGGAMDKDSYYVEAEAGAQYSDSASAQDAAVSNVSADSSVDAKQKDTKKTAVSNRL